MIKRILLIGIILIFLISSVNADTLISNGVYDAVLRQSGTSGVSFSTLRNGAGNYVSNTPAGTVGYAGYTTAHTSINNYTYHRRYIVTFNGSLIGSTSTLNSAKIIVYGYSKAKYLGKLKFSIIDASPASYTTFVSGDYDGTTYTRLSTDILYDDFRNPDLTNNFTLNSDGLSKVSKTGYFAVMFDHNSSVENVDPVWASASETAFILDTVSSPSYKPFLEVEFTPPDTTPPASITGLSGEVIDCHTINWTWTNPTDSDYGNLIIYKNGVFFHNVTNTTTHDLWTGLTGSTPYTFSSQTCDLNYNCNQTWVNLTKTTTVCPPFTVSFTSNVTCGNVPFDVQFNDTTIGYPLTWSWLFGDGNSSAVQNPVFRYNMTGLYTVNLTANNTFSSGASNITGYIRAMDSWGICPLPTTTPLPWTPDINPSTDTGVNPWETWLVSMWWLWLLIVLFLILVKK